MIQNVIFDIGNVLAKFNWEGIMDRIGIHGEDRKRLAKATVQNPLWHEFDRGSKSLEELIPLFVANDPEIEATIRLFFSDVHDIVAKFDYAIPWIESLKTAGYHVYVLSNFPEVGHKQCKEALDFLPHVDGGILSYQDKLIKPDPAIYQLLLKRYGLQADECVFLDDLERNIEAAKQEGMHGIVFVDQEQAIAELAKLGVVTE